MLLKKMTIIQKNIKKYKKIRNKTIIFGIIGTIYYILVYMIALYIVQSA